MNSPTSSDVPVTEAASTAGASAGEKKRISGKKGLLGLLLLTLLYIISPVDLLPESLLGPVGLADDAILLAYLIKRLWAYFRR